VCSSDLCLFPAVVAGGSMTFPDRYRGLGMTLVMASFDVGNLVGAPTVGVILHSCEVLGMPPYPTMFVSVTAILAVATVYYAVASRR
jgi:predicted MFS family arabinose efflux permease